MKFHSGIDAKHLMKMLGESLQKEKKQWKSVCHKKSGNEQMDSLGQHRDEAISWILSLNAKFHFTPETVALAVYLVDRFLLLVKVPSKYLRCVSICCYYIAAKTLEEDEVIPSTGDLVKGSDYECSVSEILRMESIILNKLSWNIKYVTAIDFLHIIHSLLMCYYPQLLNGLSNMTPSKHLAILTQKLLKCLGDHQITTFRPVTLSLSVISHELEQITPNWLSIVMMIQQMTEVDSGCLIRCREQTGRFLTENYMLQTGYSFLRHGSSCSKAVKRKAEEVEDDDDIYEGIKRLYNEDFGIEMRMSCGSEGMYQDTDQLSAVSAM